MPLPWSSRSSLRRALCLAAAVAVVAALTTAAPALASRDTPGCGGDGGPPCPVVSDTGPSWLPHLSADGRYVSFSSYHDLLHDGGGGIYRFDGLTGATVRVNVDDAGERNGRYSPGSGISADGDRVLFGAVAPGAPAGTDIEQLYVREFSSGRTLLVTANTAGDPTTGWVSPWPTISADGRFVAFSAESGDLVAGDRPTQPETEVYLRDLTLGTTTRVSVGPAGLGQLTNSNACTPVVSGDGRYVAFTAIAALTPDDTDAAQDVYVRDMQTGHLEVASKDSDGRLMPWSGLFGMSDDGTRIVLGATDTDGSGAAIFVHDRLSRATRRLSTLDATGPQVGERVAISGDGNVVAAQTSRPVGADDRDGRDDVVLIDTRTGTVRPTTPDGVADPPDAQVVDPSLSFDGSVLAVDTAWHHTDSPNPGSNLDLGNSEVFVFSAVPGAWDQITPEHRRVTPPAATPPPPGPSGSPSPGSPGEPIPAAPADGPGYWMVTDAGAVYSFGTATGYGDGGAHTVDIEPTPAMDGYWTLDETGRVSAHGAAVPMGSAILRSGERATSLSATRSGRGYRVFTDTGRAATFGDAASYGDMAGVPLNGPVLDSVMTPSGKGYWMVASDGGIFSFGDARFSGSMGGRRLNKPIVSMAADPDGTGYWLVASDGGIFAFDADFHGSLGAVHLNQPVTGMVPGPGGYLMVATDGGIFAFGDVPFSGSLGATPPAHPVVAVALKR